jgi:hypothetical protein
MHTSYLQVSDPFLFTYVGNTWFEILFFVNFLLSASKIL